MEDQKIIALFLERSEQAIVELDQKYGKTCRKLSWQIVNDRMDAEECVNDAYLGVWNTVPPEHPNPLLTYLCRIVRNLSFKYFDKKTAAKRNGNCSVALQELEAVLADKNTVEAAFAVRELARTLEAFLNTLSVENRVIFLRRYWFLDSYDDIAKRVGCREKTVSVRLVRIRRKLKQYLLEQGVLP